MLCNMLTNWLPNTVSLLPIMPLNTTYCRACCPMQYAAQHASPHLILFNMLPRLLPNLTVNTIFCPSCRPTQHTINCRQTTILACDPTKYVAHHAAQQNMLSNKTCSFPNIACCTTCCSTYLPISPPWVVMGNLLYFCKYSAINLISA